MKIVNEIFQENMTDATFIVPFSYDKKNVT